MSRFVKLAGQAAGASGTYVHPSCICQTILCSPCIKQEYPKDGTGTFCPTSQWVTIANCEDWQGTATTTCWKYNFCDFKEIKFFFQHAACTSFTCPCMFVMNTDGEIQCQCCRYMHNKACGGNQNCCHFLGQGFVCACHTIGYQGRFYPWPNQQFNPSTTCQDPLIGWEVRPTFEGGGYNTWQCMTRGIIGACINPSASHVMWCNFGGVGVSSNANLNNFSKGGKFWYQGLLCDGGNVGDT